jgi:hypothetical protein
MFPNLELSARFRTQVFKFRDVLPVEHHGLPNVQSVPAREDQAIRQTKTARRRPDIKGHALSWQGFGSSRAAGGAALIISD